MKIQAGFQIGETVIESCDKQNLPLIVKDVFWDTRGFWKITARYENPCGSFEITKRSEEFRPWTPQDVRAPVREMSAVEIVQATYDGPIPAGKLEAAYAEDARCAKESAR